MNLANVSILCFAASYALAFVLELLLLWQPSRPMRFLQQAVTFIGIIAHVIYAQQHALSFHSGSATLLLVSLILAIFYFSGSLHYQRFVWGLFILPVILA